MFRSYSLSFSVGEGERHFLTFLFSTELLVAQRIKMTFTNMRRAITAAGAKQHPSVCHYRYYIEKIHNICFVIYYLALTLPFPRALSLVALQKKIVNTLAM